MATVKSGFNMDSIKGWMESNRITEVECLFPDFTGNARGKIIPANKFLREGGMRLPEVIFTQTVTGEYPDDDSMIDPLERDMQLYPDPNTIRFVPWALEPTAQVIHDCFDVNGKLIDIAPRSVLRRVLSFYEKQGWKPVVAPELGILSGHPQRGPRLSAGAAGGSQRPPGDRPPVVQYRCGQRVRPHF